jgi:hypothetical protein
MNTKVSVKKLDIDRRKIFALGHEFGFFLKFQLYLVDASQVQTLYQRSTSSRVFMP